MDSKKPFISSHKSFENVIKKKGHDREKILATLNI